MNVTAVGNEAGGQAPGELPLVSVIIISYNQEDYIEAAVLSCMRQTYGNIEIIVSDDASTDATVARVAVLQGGDERIKLHSAERNRGITGNVQFALDQCRGKYIAFVGGDDLLYPTKVAVQVACMEADPEIALSFTRCHVIHGTDLTPVRITADSRISDVADGYELARNFGVEIPGPAPMVRSSMAPAGGFRTIAPVASDWLFFIETSYRHKCQLIKTPLAAYRMHENNIGKNRYAYVGDYCSSYEFIRNQYAHDAQLVRAARAALRRYLLGSYYASIMEGNLEAAGKVVGFYKQHFGGGVSYMVLTLLGKGQFASLFARLKPILKKFV